MGGLSPDIIRTRLRDLEEVDVDWRERYPQPGRITDSRLVRCDFSGRSFTGVELSRVDFSFSDFRGCTFERCALVGCCFVGCHLEGVDLGNSFMADSC